MARFLKSFNYIVDHEGIKHDKLQLTGQNLGQVFNPISGCLWAMRLWCHEAKWPNLKLKTQPKQLLGYLLLTLVLS